MLVDVPQQQLILHQSLHRLDQQVWQLQLVAQLLPDLLQNIRISASSDSCEVKGTGDEASSPEHPSPELRHSFRSSLVSECCSYSEDGTTVTEHLTEPDWARRSAITQPPIHTQIRLVATYCLSTSSRDI
ncbi:hypothetical protein E2C01_001786 [Portunus trituberculatus]|uniref:Uncharacterized protein n=1 Tax=Portunus trituberculatus TaxID=210409 RepID=A0A5B7CKD2_PORTR|nr:hypothetical protein [Portunus trituberculatus]